MNRRNMMHFLNFICDEEYHSSYNVKKKKNLRLKINDLPLIVASLNSFIAQMKEWLEFRVMNEQFCKKYIEYDALH